MGNAVPCGIDVEEQREAQRIQRRRSSRARLESSCSSSLSSLQPSESPQESPEVSAEMIPKPLSSVFIQNTQEPQKGPRGAAQGHCRSSRHLSGTHVLRSSKPPNSPQYNNTTTDDAGAAADGAQSNELSFSVPEIDSRPSSSGTLEHESPTAASYSFGSHDGDEVTNYVFADRSDQFDDRFSPGPAASVSAVPRKETPAVPESAFVAWEMGFGIISGAHRASPISSPIRANTKSSTTEKPSSTPAAPATVVAPLAASSNTTGNTTTTPAGLSSITATEQVPKQKSVTTPTSPRLSNATKKQSIASSAAATPSLPTPTPLSTTTKTSAQTAPPPQQQRRLSGLPQLRSAPNAQRMKSTTDSDKSQLAKRKLAAVHAAARMASPSPPIKKANPPLQPANTSLGLSGQMDHFELYDLNFINAGAPLTAASITAGTATPPTIKTAATMKSEAALSGLASPPGILSPPNRAKVAGHSPPPSISPPTVKDAGKTGNHQAAPTFSNFLSPTQLSANAAKKQGNPSPSSSSKVTSSGDKAGGDGKSAASSGVAAAAHCSFPQQPDSAEPGGSALPLLRHSPKAANGAPTASSSSPTLPRNSTAETGSKSGKGVPLPSTSSLTVSAAAAAAARGEDPMDGPINGQGRRSPEKPRRRKRSSHHRRHRHRRRSSRKNTLYGGGDDEDESGSTSATDDSSGLDELEESAPNLRASQKVDSILVRSGSFKSRGGGSVGPQDLTTATGSVSFLLCEKEAELAMASSQFMSKAVPRRRKERLRRMNEDFGMGVLNDIEGDAEEATTVEDAVTPSS